MTNEYYMFIYCINYVIDPSCNNMKDQWYNYIFIYLLLLSDLLS